MTTVLTREQVAALMTTVADTLIAKKDELTALDADLGDGDLGRTIERGFNGIKAAIAQGGPEGEDVGRMLFRLGKAFSNDAASSFGALFGTALMKGGQALKDKQQVTLSEIADATDAALKALMERGKAQLGDKTMLDAIAPALEAMRAASPDNAPAEFFRAAAAAAQQGAEATQHMQSKIGRASWQGERSSGKMDPGARAIAMMLEAAAQGS